MGLLSRMWGKVTPASREFTIKTTDRQADYVDEISSMWDGGFGRYQGDLTLTIKFSGTIGNEIYLDHISLKKDGKIISSQSVYAGDELVSWEFQEVSLRHDDFFDETSNTVNLSFVGVRGESVEFEQSAILSW